MDPEDAERDEWYAEADAIEVCHRDFEVADAAELPKGSLDFEHAAAEDPMFESDFERWLDFLSEDPTSLLGLEQACHQGIRLPWDMRGVRLATAGDLILARLHWYWTSCPRHTSAYVDNYVYWLVRAERSRRRGTPDWSPQSPLPPSRQERAFFRPPVLTLRRYGNQGS